MSRSVRLRPWQKAALDRLAATAGPDFLAVATPGAGKTTFALVAARQHLAASPRARLVVVTPTQHLKAQWAAAAAALDLHLEPAWSASAGTLPADVHGVVTTYQQVAGSAAAVAALARGAFVVLDEVHHAGDERAWGEGVATAFGDAARRLSLSGTPFRSDTAAIPFVRYEWDEARPDFEYGYGDALGDGGVVRPVHFPLVDGHMEWSAPDGSLHSAGFGDALDPVLASQRLRTALSLDGEWLPAVLRQAHERLTAIRADHPQAGGLVIAADQDHARGIAELLERRFGARALVATSDDAGASLRISRFAAGDTPWLVAVRMVSEGVDIPRLRVGVYATTTTTELFFRQAVGRFVRWTKGLGRQPAWVYLPDDPRLRVLAERVAEQRRHSLKRRPEQDDRPDDGELDELVHDDDRDQLSLFAAISAVAVGEARQAALPVDGAAAPEVDPEDGHVTLALPPLPGGGVAVAGGASGSGGALRRRELRDLNSERARTLAKASGWSHAKVNAELNRLAGVERVTSATVVQLERRLRHADRWLEQLRRVGKAV